MTGSYARRALRRGRRLTVAALVTSVGLFAALFATVAARTPASGSAATPTPAPAVAPAAAPITSSSITMPSPRIHIRTRAS
jgi:hypothetical protein